MAIVFEDINSVFEDMKLSVNVFFKTFDFETFSVGIDAVGFDLILNIAFGAISGVVGELMGDEDASVAFELKVFSFRIIVSEEIGFDVFVSSPSCFDDSTCDDATSDEVSSTEYGSEDLVSSEIASSDIVSSDIVSVDINSADTVSTGVDSDDVSDIVSKNITSGDVSNDITSQFTDISRNPGSGLGAIEFGVIEIRAIE